MQKSYHIEMKGDGDLRRTFDMPADSAADAIGRALEQNRGFKVVRCYAGGVAQDARYAGVVEYEVPPHQALPPEEPKVKRQKTPCEMFNDAEIIEQSKATRSRMMA